MPSNNYDEVAIARAKDLARNQILAHAYIEKPAMFSLLPNLRGKHVLCLGCGTGEECTELVKRGALVHGVDSSKVSIGYAKEHVASASFQVLDIASDMAKLQHNVPFDLVYSSLVMHYIKDIGKLFKELHGLLTANGYLLFSTCHPVKWAAKTRRDPHDNNKKSFIMGYEREGHAVKLYGNYLEEQKFRQVYPDGLVADYWMRPPSWYFKTLKEAGFEVIEFLEPGALPEVQHIDPVFWEIHHKLPQWMIFLAKKLTV